MKRAITRIELSDQPSLLHFLLPFNIADFHLIHTHKIALNNKNNKSKLKDEFISIASHELRTPMTAIKSYLWMVLNKKQAQDQITAKTTGYLDRAYNSTERLIALVNDMLDVTRIEEGRVELKPIAFQLCDLANEVKTEVQAQADEKHLQLTIQPCDLPNVKADQDKTHQVFLNLIGNALKFTDSGGAITISFSLKGNSNGKSNGNYYVETSVSDTGQGIPKEDQAKLFTKFGRLEGSLTAMAKHKGTGLGLYIFKPRTKKAKLFNAGQAIHRNDRRPNHCPIRTR